MPQGWQANLAGIGVNSAAISVTATPPDLHALASSPGLARCDNRAAPCGGNYLPLSDSAIASRNSRRCGGDWAWA